MIKADLNGRRVLVTGGASGIGLGCVRMMAEMGARVALNHLADDPAGPARVSELRELGLDVISAPGDVAVAGTAEDMVKVAIEAMGWH